MTAPAMLMLPSAESAMPPCFPAPCKAVALGRRTPCRARCGLEGQVVVPEPYSRWLLRSCTQFSLMTMGAAIHRRWGCCLLSTVVLFAGLNYWRRATFGWRRFCDMAAVTVTVLYHSMVAFGFLGHGLAADSPFALLCQPLRPWMGVGPYIPAFAPTGYALMTVCFVGMYLRARHFAARKEFHKSTPWHLAVHVTGNFGNLLMYPGLKP
ncbi:unnamed protein product [Cladocopium goreaui]|uniref:Crinkler effector protein N-terminal domain-containing protein n=1 Tax=Cladocopium goreaui TaxID=2562237 RepID=A0A9P1GI26_9DINO|nr:unnamed protein product [Cladocopium goreaui]